MQWGGADAFVRKLNYRQRGMVYAGDRIVLRGTVSNKSEDQERALVSCALTVTKTDGTEIVRDATAAIELGRRP